VDLARGRGLEVLELDMSIPFTAARARNAGLRRLRERWPALRYVQLVDADCVLAPGWLEAAVAELDASPHLAMVCGRRRELHPDASVFNRLCDMEWDTPVGDASSCGGDALARIDALLDAGGYDERLIAGEEPELCARLRQRGLAIRRLGVDMTWHDAAMTRPSQWWRRCVRSGYGFAQVNATRPGLYAREARSAILWTVALPAVIAAAAVPTAGLSLLLSLAYPALAWRVARYRRSLGSTARDAALYGAFCVLGKLPEAAGVLRCWWHRGRGRRGRIIEYK
jgi:GT2 family glycosyltransferase